MKFIDNEHKFFVFQKYEQLKRYGKEDVYYRSLIYTLGLSDIVREHFKEIFDIKNGEINIDSINAKWQTSSTAKITRMAFSLWNECNYDSEEDIEKEKISTKYNVGEIFSCSYAPYFYEAIKIRYPEYTKESVEKSNVLEEIEK